MKHSSASTLPRKIAVPVIVGAAASFAFAAGLEAGTASDSEALNQRAADKAKFIGQTLSTKGKIDASAAIEVFNGDITDRKHGRKIHYPFVLESTAHDTTAKSTEEFNPAALALEGTVLGYREVKSGKVTIHTFAYDPGTMDVIYKGGERHNDPNDLTIHPALYMSGGMPSAADVSGNVVGIGTSVASVEELSGGY